jgi:endoglucanase
VGDVLGRLAFLMPALLAPACSGGGAGPGPDSGTDASADSTGGDAASDDGASPDGDASTRDDAMTDASPGAPLPALPLRTSGRWIVDAKGKRFKLAAVNWYGAEEMDYVVAGLDKAPLAQIAHMIRTMGFNSVRLPWSNEMAELDPVVADAGLSDNPQLQGKHALGVLDAVIEALAYEGIVVILDNHTSRADWCCSNVDGEGLWYDATYTEAKWIADWKAMIARYASQPAVVGADLRNEPRSVCIDGGCVMAAWGGGDPSTDWRAAAQRGGDAVLAVDSTKLVFVEGVSYALDLTGVYSNPAQLSVPNRLVYEAHDYAFDHVGLTSYAQLKTDLGNQWGYILTQNQPYTAPVWVGEFGTCHTSKTCISNTNGQGLWFEGIRQYLTDADIDWSYWPLDGTQARGNSRIYGAEDTYGVLDKTWTKPALPELLTALQAIQAATQGP